jgi:type I restriction enzyme R subunit
MMNEAETRAELIDPKLKACGWGVVDGTKVLREHHITLGRIQAGGRGKKEIADYILVYKGIKLAVIEAKSDEFPVSEGVMQAKSYAKKLNLDTTYSTNGKEIYQICMKTGEESLVENYLTPDELWDKTFADQNNLREKFANIPFEDKSGTWQPRYYQEISINNALEAIADGKKRILLTLATGTGKTSIAFQISWKLFHTRWNIQQDFKRRPRILFLADRNILADQAFNSFSSFPDDALVRIKPSEIRKKGRIPTNGSVFFTIFQTFMSGSNENGEPAPYFGDYPDDFFDLIIIDECHRGGANDESNWRDIMNYFSDAVQIGLTATPKRDDNVDTYRYFGDPVYIYSLKEGINDGFLTPFKVKRIKTTLDDYRYTSDDTVIQGDIDKEKLYEEKDFNRTIEIEAREANRVKIFLENCNQKEKAMIFGATQNHAALIRDLVNQLSKSDNPFYCVRVTANDGAEGERYLEQFQDDENTIPTILTSSQKLSTGVDAKNVRNIVLMRSVNSMIEFKQIIGRGTRLFEGKEFFTIYDFVDAYKHFSDPEWDGEPLEPEPCKNCGQIPCICIAEPPKVCNICGERPCVCIIEPPEPCEICGESPCECERKNVKIKIKLSDGKERQIKHMVDTSFWSANGNPISAEEFLKNLFGELPKLFQDEQELRKIWSNPETRKKLLQKLDEAGFPKSDLVALQKMVDMEQSDLYDVLEYVFNGNYVAISRESRAKATEATFYTLINDKQKEFIAYVLNQYIEIGIDELDREKLPILLTNKYQSLEDAMTKLGKPQSINDLFIELQKHMYMQDVA